MIKNNNGTGQIITGRRLRTEAGQSLVEFALVLPLLLFILFGIIDFSRLLYTRALLAYDLRDAARLLAVGSSINTVAAQLATGLKPVLGDVTVSVTSGSDDQGSAATVINLQPAGGAAARIYVTPPYTPPLAAGSTVRVKGTIPFTYITPLGRWLVPVTVLEYTCYTRLEITVS